ncbi:hypothetical protein DPMN_081559 [Dreissena polymorpha]|uniref:Uncharacterized protein n=1 Tax=Dreissena polymorpha TaxID=45954 RepID=A0A9D4BG15_DREPO|nr:hypothetical protein DPMN_081559 [Dreissena polymorpha]
MEDEESAEGTTQHRINEFYFFPDPDKLVWTHYPNLNASDSGLHHTVSLMYVGGRHIGFGTTLENKMADPS